MGLFLVKGISVDVFPSHVAVLLYDNPLMLFTK